MSQNVLEDFKRLESSVDKLRQQYQLEMLTVRGRMFDVAVELNKLLGPDYKCEPQFTQRTSDEKGRFTIYVIKYAHSAEVNVLSFDSINAMRDHVLTVFAPQPTFSEGIIY